jgi:hypothetical protein
VVTGAQLTKVLIDSGAALNVIFASTLQKMGLDIIDLLTPTDTPFYGIVPEKAAVPLGQFTLPVTFGTEENYQIEYIRFKVAYFDSLYHTIFEQIALPMFMAIPHYPYLLLKTSGPNGVHSLLRGDLKRSYDCDTKSVQLAAKAQLSS